MATTVICQCGNSLSTGAFPNEGAFYLVAEIQYDELQHPIDSLKVAQLMHASGSVLECDNCGRLLVDRDKSGNYEPYCREMVD